MFQVESKLICEGLVVRESTYTQSLFMKMHQDDVTQVIFLLDGAIQHSSPQATQQILPSTLTFLPKGAPHATEFQPGVRSFELLAFSSFAQRLQQAELGFTEQQIHTQGSATALAKRLYQEFRTPDSLTPLLMEGLTLELFVALGRTQTAQCELAPPRWLKTAHAFLHAHFTESLSLESIAVAAGVHPSHLARGFRQHYHCTIGDYIRKLRVERACTLLTRTKPCLAELALELGFADQGHFSRTFKQLMGLTPTAFRNATLR